MRALHLCQHLLQKSLTSMHATRCAALWFGVQCLLVGQSLSVTALGRACGRAMSEKHGIKKIDRLVGNPHLFQERHRVFGALAKVLLGRMLRPILVVDWTPWRDGFHALTVGLPVGGRCIVFYGEVHEEKQLNHPKVHKAFLDNVAAMLPAGCLPVVVTDGGFRTSWLDDVTRRGWDFVARVRGRIYCRKNETSPWILLAALFERADTKPRCLGTLTFTKSEPRAHRAIIIKKRGRKRKAKRVLRKTPGHKKRVGHAHNVSSADKYYREVAEQPWVLLTSMQTVAAREIVRIYALRMQTEETYRGLKSQKYGWAFNNSRSTTKERLTILLLIGTLATWAVCVVGWIAEQGNIHHRYQANTTRGKRVLSWFYLGMRIIRNAEEKLNAETIRNALAAFTIAADAGGGSYA